MLFSQFAKAALQYNSIEYNDWNKVDFHKYNCIHFFSSEIKVNGIAWIWTDYYDSYSSSY